MGIQTALVGEAQAVRSPFHDVCYPNDLLTFQRKIDNKCPQRFAMRHTIALLVWLLFPRQPQKSCPISPVFVLESLLMLRSVGGIGTTKKIPKMKQELHRLHYGYPRNLLLNTVNMKANPTNPLGQGVPH